MPNLQFLWLADPTDITEMTRRPTRLLATMALLGEEPSKPRGPVSGRVPTLQVPIEQDRD